ncbi:MarR family winged helix-turn-helix transcriptional regulator [Nocardia alni]|uniref:MarR family winged helix-turn-helix transcriptional regulator n=1 Tax=Nocardia alni TaxID=2815723 RepID=UPI001C217BCB|nr:MarR family transcriptional regulator [Nocardia alni]
MEANKDQIAALVRTVSRFAEANRQGQAREFDPVRLGVLQQAAEHGPLRAGEVAERLDALPSSITRHVRVLADAGLVLTEPDPADRRAVLVTATETGRAELAQFLQVGEQVFGAVIADWTANEVVALTELLTKLTDAWERHGLEQQRAARRRHRPFGWSQI